MSYNLHLHIKKILEICKEFLKGREKLLNKNTFDQNNLLKEALLHIGLCPLSCEQNMSQNLFSFQFLLFLLSYRQGPGHSGELLMYTEHSHEEQDDGEDP